MKNLNAKIYVGTYKKYNEGSISGEWLNLSDYSNRDDFYEACSELHSDEEDPEFMFQDWENIPDGFISESWISEKYWEYAEAIEELGDTEKEAFYIWLDNFSYNLAKEEISDLIENFNEAYAGEYDSDIAFADELADELGYFDAMKNAGISSFYFDSEAFARDLLMGDYWTSGGYYFRSN